MRHADPDGDAGEPVFCEPWEASAFALAVKLCETGLFTWEEWTATLAEEIAAAGDPDPGGSGYRHWPAALETLVTAKTPLTAQALAERKEAWRRAYLATPHGRPVELAAGD